MDRGHPDASRSGNPTDPSDPRATGASGNPTDPTDPTDPRATLAALTAAQDGVFSRRQARDAGWSAFRIRRRIDSGEWVALHGGRVLRASGTPLTWAGAAHAALLATSRAAVLGGPSAAKVHGIDVPWPQPAVVVPSGSRREPSGITVIRDDLDDDDIALLDDFVVTGKRRTVVDCLVLLPETAGRTFLDRALQQHWTTLDDLVFRSHLMSGRPGVARLRRQVAVASFGVRSEGERVLRRILRRAGITGWVADWALAGVGILDFAFPDLRLAIEVDGRAWHSAGDRFQHDRTRQNALVARGWTVLRFTWEDLSERPDQVLATVRTTLLRLAAAS